jgi:hypothetical protein
MNSPSFILPRTRGRKEEGAGYGSRTIEPRF